MNKPRGKFAVKPADFIIFALPLIIAAVFIAVFSGAADNNDIRIAKIILDGKTVRTVALDTAKNQTIDLGLEYGNIIECGLPRQDLRKNGVYITLGAD